MNIAVAYNVWQYYVVTGDREFLSHYGAEMIMEVARLFASLATLDGATGRYHITGVMGPDEYHEKYPGSNEPGLRNNAYTNVMAVWVMERALEIRGLLPAARVSEIAERIGLEPDEVERWRDITRKMTVPFHGDGIISQFEGYERLEEFDWKAAQEKHGDIKRLDRILKAEGDSPDRYKLSKQADVLMLFYLLPPKDLAPGLREARLHLQPGHPSQDGRVLPPAHQPRLHPEQGRPRLGDRPASTGGRPGLSSRRRSRPTSPTSRGAPPRRASTWGP